MSRRSFASCGLRRQRRFCHVGAWHRRPVRDRQGWETLREGRQPYVMVADGQHDFVVLSPPGNIVAGHQNLRTQSQAASVTRGTVPHGQSAAALAGRNGRSGTSTFFPDGNDNGLRPFSPQPLVVFRHIQINHHAGVRHGNGHHVLRVIVQEPVQPLIRRQREHGRHRVPSCE